MPVTQFGHFVPQLGDAGHLLGEVKGQDGRRYDIQLKGSGPTAFSRRGDGRAAVGSVLREYLLSEAMAALGCAHRKSSRCRSHGRNVFCGRPFYQERFSARGVKPFASGTFEYFAARHDVEATRVLADHAIARHIPPPHRQRIPIEHFLTGSLRDRRASSLSGCCSASSME